MTQLVLGINIKMLFYILVAILIAILYVSTKYVVKPYLWMKKYKNTKGVSIEPFVPIVGGLFHLWEDFKKYGDEYTWKRNFARKNPETRIILTNLRTFIS